MDILVIGSGGREHALAWKLGQSDQVSRVFVAPGNDGIAADADIDAECVDIAGGEHEALADFAEENDVALTVVGPEAPLCDGIVGVFEARGLTVFGPTAEAARLEGSKSFAKDVMTDAGVPTADYDVFEELDAALAHVESADHPVAIKADGLAGGKGVVISEDLQTSRETLEEYLADERFGEASSTVVIEECLVGEEVSFIVVCDGERVVPLASSRDHKRVGEGDTGPNTGGMGAVAPAPGVDDQLEAQIMREVIDPTLEEIERRDGAYRGFLYAGLMLTEEGPKVLEFNCRMGDPETQPLLFAMEADLAPVLLQAARGQLAEGTDLRTDRHACCVVLASGGYPSPERDTGYAIEGLEEAASQAETKVFHAGTRLDDGRFINAGGRVLGVTGRGDSHEQARQRAYQAVEEIDWPGMHYRRDIGE